MKRYLGIVFVFLASYFAFVPQSLAQDPGWNTALDSLREQEAAKPDTVIFSSRYVRYTTLGMMRRGTFTYQIDTSHQNFQYYNPQNQPLRPSINLGSYGLATRDLLFEPDKSIGFQMGRHSLERYLYTTDSVRFYRARAPYSELYNVGFFFDDQVIRATISQNINERLNVGGEFHAAGTNGYYSNQRYNDMKWVFFGWYESKSKRYNLMTTGVFNKLVSTENGSILNDTVFRDTSERTSEAQFTRLKETGDNRPRNTWRDHEVLLRQSIYLGRVDTINRGLPEQQLLPTNRMFHIARYRRESYDFFKNESDVYGAFPKSESVLTQDTSTLTNVRNEFGYSFFLRPGHRGVLKNEIKLDLGFQHDLYWLKERAYSVFFQNSMVSAGLGYAFSDRVQLTGDFQQIVQGQQAGDFLYEVNSTIAMGDYVGSIQLGAYTQNKSPEWIYRFSNTTYHQWNEEFSKTKTNSLYFTYKNPLLGFQGTAGYYLINNYLYFEEEPNPDFSAELAKVIKPVQYAPDLHLLKISVRQNFRFSRFYFKNHLVYQKSDAQDLLSIPEWYSWHSFYFNGLLDKVLDFNLGVDVRFNTPFQTPSYAINIGQFYQDNAKIHFSTYPIADVWGTMTLKRVNLFLSYNFLNQNFYPNGYYTVRRYPMNNANFRIGVRWKFYD